jgi:DNA-binding GntR family transcriptional regulator
MVTGLVPGVEQMVKTLRAQILSGELKPSTPLNQNDLAEAFDLNRSQVREGLSALAEERLVRMRPYATAVVAPLSLDEFQELHEIRVALEPLLSRLALPSVTRQHILQMQHLIQRMEETTDGATWLDANDQFHASLYRLAPRPWLVEIADRARRLNSRYTRVLVFEMENRTAEHEHSQILRLIEDQDSRELERRLLDHIKSGHDLVLEHLDHHPDLLESSS